MPANTTPIFVTNSNVGKTLITAANVKTDGSGTIGTDIFVAFSAGANGSRVDSITFTNASNNGVNTSSATRLSCYISTQSSGITSSANTFIISEVALPSNTARSATNAGSTFTFNFPGGLLIQSGLNILVTSSIWSSVSPSVDNYAVVTRGGDY